MDEAASPREQFLASQEILGTIEWIDVLQNHATATEAMALFNSHMSILLHALKTIKAKKFSRFLKDTVLALTRPVKALHRIREYVEVDPTTEIAQQAQRDDGMFQAFEETILSKVIELVHTVVGQWNGHQIFQLKLNPEQDNELNNQHYILIYLILLILDQWVAPQEMEASSTYFEYVNPKYKNFSPNGPNRTTTPKKDNLGTLRHLQRLMNLCTECHLSIEDLLVWKPTPVFSTGIDDNDDSYDEEALIEDNYPLSETGITTLVSGMIYTTIDSTHLSSTFTLPLALAQDWVFTSAGGLASGFLNSDTSQHAMADKALSVLLYAIDRLPSNNRFKMEILDFCSTDSSTDRMGLFQIFQVMVTFASTSESSSHRFFAFQALDRLIQGCEDDVKLYLLDHLVAPSCPFESMRAAAINLVKGTVERAFQELDRVREANTAKVRSSGGEGQQQQQQQTPPSGTAITTIQSPFTSPLLLKTFKSSIWGFEVKAFQHSPLKNEVAWTEKYDTFMHALNFYLFLLMRDDKDDNLTEVWSTSNIQEIHKEFLEPLLERVEELKEEYIERLARAEEEEAKGAGLVDEGDNEHKENAFTRRLSLQPPKHKIKSKNGVVNFDIDMESGDEDDYDDDEDDDDDRAGDSANLSHPKDSVMALNQSMMRVELMDEVLERIRDLTKDRL
ncbi:hypothetical protein BG004_007773 [Podila humilis]|nr:hypothetical protein BG004_007773 [Podila humilis]